MGLSIKKAIETLLDAASFGAADTAKWVAIDTMRKYQQLQADYETRLKADMVAMLEELKEQLRELHEDFFETEHFDEAYGVSDSMDVIQEKINALRGEK